MPEEKVTKTKVKKKRWVQVLSPELFRNESIGEVPVSEPGSLIERTITVNLMSLTRDIKKQNTSLKFIITNIKGDKAITQFHGYYLNSTSIRRLVRRGKEKIGLSIICKTFDNKKVRIMPLMIPYNKVKGSVASAFKKSTINYLTSYAAKTTFENMIRDLIANRLQRELKGVLKKVYPIRILEIAKLHIEREKKPVEKKVGVKVERKEEVKEEKPKEEKVEEKKEEATKEEEEKPKEEEVKKEEKLKEEKEPKK